MPFVFVFRKMMLMLFFCQLFFLFRLRNQWRNSGEVRKVQEDLNKRS